VSYDDYDTNAVQLALDLASLGEATLSMPEFTSAQEPMFADHGYPPSAITAADTAILTGLGRSLAAVLAEPDEDAFIDRLAVLLDAQDCRPQLTRHDGLPHLHFARDGAPLPRWLGSLAVSGLVRYVCQSGRSRLRRCAAAGCGRWYADTSRNSSRRYCSHACASRTTVAAHRARTRPGSPG
jgi:predicted RNA-binding Zn ribbon-like protein